MERLAHDSQSLLPQKGSQNSETSSLLLLVFLQYPLKELVWVMEVVWQITLQLQAV